MSRSNNKVDEKEEGDRAEAKKLESKDELLDQIRTGVTLKNYVRYIVTE